jgi:hypothetical protein
VFREGLPSVGEWAATSPHYLQVSNQIQSKERAPLLCLVDCHLKRAPPLQEGRTSLIAYANISKDITQSNANQYDLCPL